MSSILAPLLVGRAVGGWRYIRAALLIILFGCVIVGVIYAAVFFDAARNLPEKHHVQHNSAH
jgi:hypothetical protein